MREGARKRAGAAPGPPASLSGLKTPLSGSSAFEQVDGAFFRSPGYPASAAGWRGRRPRGALPARARDRTRLPTLLPAALRAPMRAGPGTALSRTHPDLRRWEAGIAVYGVFAPRKAPQITVYFIIFAANRYISIRTTGVFVVLFGSSFPARAATAPTYSQVRSCLHRAVSSA